MRCFCAPAYTPASRARLRAHAAPTCLQPALAGPRSALLALTGGLAGRSSSLRRTSMADTSTGGAAGGGRPGSGNGGLEGHGNSKSISNLGQWLAEANASNASGGSHSKSTATKLSPFFRLSVSTASGCDEADASGAACGSHCRNLPGVRRTSPHALWPPACLGYAAVPPVPFMEP